MSQNVLVSDDFNPNEPSIMMDPMFPNRILAASNINNYYISSDTGRTWISKQLNSSFGVWGDPVLDIDTAGHFYFFHLSNPSQGNWIDRIVCQKSIDHGANWTDGSFTGLNGTKAQDKQWSIIDRTNNNIYLTWTQFDQYGSANDIHKSNIMFSKSLDGGTTWTDAKRINKVSGDCIDSDNTTEGAVPAIGPNNEVYVAWAGPAGLVFDKSLDGGAHWLDDDIFIDPMPTGWDYAIPGIYRSNGLPVTKCDLSGGAYHGTIYVNWSDQRNGPNDTDVWLSKSVDGGNAWSTPKRVNNDGLNHHQFLTWMDIDQSTGYLYFVFYDRRNYNSENGLNDNRTDVFLAISKDGGTTFENRKISETPFLPNPGVFFEDYNNIVAHNGIVRPIWTRLHEGKLSIWTDISTLDTVLSIVEKTHSLEKNEIFQFPNPVNNISYISYKLHKSSLINLELFDQDGHKIHTIISNEQKEYGKYIVPIQMNRFKLSSGIYYWKLSIDGIYKTIKTVVIN